MVIRAHIVRKLDVHILRIPHSDFIIAGGWCWYKAKRGQQPNKCQGGWSGEIQFPQLPFFCDISFTPWLKTLLNRRAKKVNHRSFWHVLTPHSVCWACGSLRELQSGVGACGHSSASYVNSVGNCYTLIPTLPSALPREEDNSFAKAHDSLLRTTSKFTVELLDGWSLNSYRGDRGKGWQRKETVEDSVPLLTIDQLNLSRVRI